MFPFKAKLTTNNKTKWKNTCEYIILHHTATGEGTIKGVLNHLTTGPVSCHFVVDTNWDAYKIGDPSDILWHAGVSEWNGRKGMNNYSVGIEIIWPLKDGGFTDEQRKTVRALTQHLMAVLNITSDRVLRHADLTHDKSFKWVLWDGKSRSRKTDVSDTFWKIDRQYFHEYQTSLIPKAL